MQLRSVHRVILLERLLVKLFSYNNNNYTQEGCKNIIFLIPQLHDIFLIPQLHDIFLIPQLHDTST